MDVLGLKIIKEVSERPSEKKSHFLRSPPKSVCYFCLLLVMTHHPFQPTIEEVKIC
jgi:hypothetical protein